MFTYIHFKVLSYFAKGAHKVIISLYACPYKCFFICVKLNITITHCHTKHSSYKNKQ